MSRVRFADDVANDRGAHDRGDHCNCYRGSGLIKAKDRILPANIIGYKGVYIRNLALHVSWQQLKDTFRVYGDVVHVEIYRKFSSTTNCCCNNYAILSRN